MRTVHCRAPGCVEVTPIEGRGAGCRDFGPKCQPYIRRPQLGSNTAPGVARAQDVLDRAASVFVPSDDCWLATLDYVVHHNANWVLDMSFRAFGSGAYPATQISHLAIDLRTGEPLTAQAAFLPRLLPELRALIASRAHQSWIRALAQYPDILAGVPEPKVTTRDLDNFIVLSDRVVFLFDYGLPHAIAVATPFSELPVAMHDLRRFVRAPGPLSWIL